MIKHILPLFVLSMVLSAYKCGSPAADAAATNAANLLDTKWNLQSLAGKAVEMPAGVQMPWVKVSSQDNQVTGFGGCNNLMGHASVDLAGKLGFPGLGSTKMFCEQTSNVERKFMEALSSTDGYKLDGNALKLLQGSTELATLVKE